jgi:3,4-dihydroxy 2-butanone 4-phosphate synthase/GTP cyclohydrolase II
LDTVEANLALGHEVDSRDYSVGARILTDLGIPRVRLLTNNPCKQVGLEKYGIRVSERVGIEATPNRDNVRYLRTKRAKLGHLLEELDYPVGVF